jgi:signal transduction histidine kinase
MSAREQPESGETGWGVDDRAATFADLALAFARAETVDSLHTALDAAARRLAKFFARPVSICEVGLSPDEKPLILRQSSLGGLTLDEGREFSDWYAQARLGNHALTPFRDGSLRGLLSRGEPGRDVELHIGIVLKGGSLSEELTALARGLADMAATTAIRAHMQRAAALEKKSLEDMRTAMRAWLEIGVDVAWEASEDGVLRCRRVLNRRGDIASIVDGMNLKSIRVDDDGGNLLDFTRQRGNVRHMHVHLPGEASGHLADREALFVSCSSCSAVDGTSYVGTFTAVERGGSSRNTREAAAMLVQMRSARAREEQHRREAEAMLQGLRLLLGPNSSADKMAQLVSLVCECIGASDACLVERGFDGKVRLLVPQQRTLRVGADASLDLVMRGATGGSMVVYDIEGREGRSIADALGLEGRQIAVLALPLRGDAAFLVCTTCRSAGFAPADLDFADRFTLLLRQALLLREEQSQLVHSAKMAALGQMSASIAHELRQPLNTISLAMQNLEYLLDAPAFDGDAAGKKVKRVLAQVDRASGVIDRMRRFGRKSMGENEAFALRDVVENAEAIVHHVLLRSGVKLEIDVSPDISVYADQLQLEQVVGNLIQNAIDAIEGVGAKRRNEEGMIRITAAPSSGEKEKVVLRVEDNGPGFSPEIVERVLKPFFTTKPADRGTGLGLAICDAIVREIGGRIEVGNHPAGGYVAVTLPRDTA